MESKDLDPADARELLRKAAVYERAAAQRGRPYLRAYAAELRRFAHAHLAHAACADERKQVCLAA